MCIRDRIIYGIRKKDYLQFALLVAVPSECRGGEIALGRMCYADAEQREMTLGVLQLGKHPLMERLHPAGVVHHDLPLRCQL